MDTVTIRHVFPDMTLRERQVCALAVQGMNSKDVGRCLAISARTVEDHRVAIYRKTKLKNMIEVAHKLFGAPKVVA